MVTGKHDALTPREMDVMNAETLQDNHLYAANSQERQDAIRNLVAIVGADTLQQREKVNLRNCAQVRKVAADYIQSCAKIGIVPSKSGLARSLGYSRSRLWAFCREHGETETAEFLSILYDAFSEIIDLAGSGGSLHPIYSIFVQKAQYQMRDNEPIETPSKSGVDYDLDAEDLRRRIMENVIIDVDEG